MKSDLFHDVARAYYGVGPEVYTLANIATHGNAPAGYALGCESGAPDQYSWSAPPLSSVADQPPDIDRVGSHLEALHDRIAGLSDFENGDEGHHWSMRDINLTLAHAAQAAGRNKIAQKYEERANAHHTAAMGNRGINDPNAELMPEKMPSSLESQPPQARSTSSGYVSPGLPAPPKQPKSMPGQKSLFTNDSQQPPADTDGEKPNFTETGTGDHVTADEEDYGLGDANTTKEPLLIFKEPAPTTLTGKAAAQKQAENQSNLAALTPPPFGGNWYDDPNQKAVWAKREADRVAGKAPIPDNAVIDKAAGKVRYAPAGLKARLPTAKPDYSLTGTGTKVQVPEKNCVASGCGKSK